MRMDVAQLEALLDSFDLAQREAALDQLISLAEGGEVELPPTSKDTNLHCHTFFSYNGYGYSPMALAWLGRKLGLYGVGIVDFDVLDAVTEFLSACDKTKLRGVAGIETRVYVPEFGDREINSPGEPGIFYLMGVGFATSQAPAGAVETLASMRQAAEGRNRRMLDRLNPFLVPVEADYDRDVLPLTPAGNATERHMLVAYDELARQAFADEGELAGFWAEKLGVDNATDLIKNVNGLRDLIRSKLMKRGGVGYMAPTPEAFPRVPQVNAMTIACGAIPCATWLDGTSDGEKAADELLGLLIDQGVGVLNIIPDRNWNYPAGPERDLKVAELNKIVALAKALDLPVIAGTEMNKYGQQLVDDFASDALAPLSEAFLEGAHFLYGHTQLERALGIGYQSAWAKENLPSRGERNAFYAAVGVAINPGGEGLAALAEIDTSTGPDGLLGQLRT
jgi:hypothetical protein